jgi:hypothetical protein
MARDPGRDIPQFPRECDRGAKDKGKTVALFRPPFGDNLLPLPLCWEDARAMYHWNVGDLYDVDGYARAG